MKSETRIRTVELSVEKCETYTIRRTRTTVTRWCGVCESQVEMSKPEDAARITGVTTRRIYSGIEAGNTHFAESADGSLMICLRSIDDNPSQTPTF
ncbi:MAG: hypothetical protein ABL999_17205 [Pyrinomonadaceae bacterium]